MAPEKLPCRQRRKGGQQKAGEERPYWNMTGLLRKAHRFLMLCPGWVWLSVCNRVARQGRDGRAHGAVEADGVRPWCGPLPERGSKTITRDLACMSFPSVRAA